MRWSDPLTRHHEARLIKTTGDGFLAEFQTIPAALHSALELQAASAKFVGTAGNPLHRPITFRIAIHGGFVIDTGDDLYGTDVNIAARLQEHAQPGGIILSAAAFEQIREHTTEVFRKVEGLWLKNIPNAVDAFELPSKLGFSAARCRRQARLYRPSPSSPCKISDLDERISILPRGSSKTSSSRLRACASCS